MSLSTKIEGVIVMIGETQVINERFQKREFAVKVENGEYPQTLKIEIVQDKCPLLDHYTEGQQVNIDINLRGREYEKDGKVMYFNTLQAWKINTPETTPHDVKTGGAGNPVESSIPVQETDDLPF